MLCKTAFVKLYCCTWKIADVGIVFIIQVLCWIFRNCAVLIFKTQKSATINHIRTLAMYSVHGLNDVLTPALDAAGKVWRACSMSCVQPCIKLASKLDYFCDWSSGGGVECRLASWMRWPSIMQRCIVPYHTITIFVIALSPYTRH